MTCDEHATWIAHKARQPGWWQWARDYARECEADDSCQWVGIVDKVRSLLGDFRPAPGESKAWHLELSLEDRIALAAQERQGLTWKRVNPRTSGRGAVKRTEESKG